MKTSYAFLRHNAFLWIACCCCLGLSCHFQVASPLPLIETHHKQKGVHLFRFNEQSDFQRIQQTNIEWITLVPWAFQKDIGSPKVSHKGDSIQTANHNQHWIEQIIMVRKKGFKVFLKPHLWIDQPQAGKWRSDIYPSNETDWHEWQRTYTEFILRYAKVAETAHAEQFCIGVEFTALTKAKPQFWRGLIREVRKIYSGQITYAANWYEEMEAITFWDDLDLIGVQAYFPLAKNKNPSLKSIELGWSSPCRVFKKLASQYKKGILFTELGYKSTPDSAIEPWTWPENDVNKAPSYAPQTQAHCYQAFFNKIWGQQWFAGVHFWQWRGEYKSGDPYFERDFTPQDKPAEAVIRRGFE